VGKAEIKWLATFMRVTPKKLKEPSSFNERLKMQKATFLLKHLGVAPFTSYNFSLYLRGPYSPTLAKEYYALDHVRANPVEIGNRNKLLKWFISKNTSWLEVASSIIAIKDQYATIEDHMVYSLLKMSKPWVNEEMFNDIRTELASRRLIGNA
jgi:uncharacterized protein YwgA